METNLINKIRGIINLKNIENENANMNEYVFTAKQTRMANEIAKDYAAKELLSEDVLRAFQNNEIYIHDFNSYAIGMHNCMFVDLEDILHKGFKTTNGEVRPPQSIRAAMQLVAVIFQCQSNCQFGGIASNKFDYDMAIYVRKSFANHFKTGLKYFKNNVKISDEDIYMSNKSLQEAYPLVYEYAYEQTVLETEQSAEALIHNLNTLESRSGNQLPFTSVNYGTDTSEEGRLVIQSMLKATIKGVGRNGTTPIFPIQIWKYKKGVSALKGDPNYDLKQLAIECSSKRIYPNFVNIDAPHLPVPTNPNEEHCSMGCRTQLGDDIHGYKGKSGRGNISPVTINLTKIGLDNGIALGERNTPDLDGFWKQLNDALDITTKALLERYEWQCSQIAKSAPFMYGNSIWKSDAYIDGEDTLQEALKHGTLAIGYLGIANMCVSLFGKHQGESKEIYDFALSVVKYIHEYSKQKTQEYQLNFSSYGTPAESLCHTQLKRTREQYGSVKGVLDRDYITNSFHIPVYHPITIKEKLELEAPFHQYSTGGSISYVELDGNARDNLKAFEQIVDYAMSLGISYFAVNHPIDSCENCGYEGIIGEECPSCHKKDGEVFIKRLRRVTGYLTSSYKEFFNNGKRAEVEDRVKHGGFRK